MYKRKILSVKHITKELSMKYFIRDPVKIYVSESAHRVLHDVIS